MTNAITQRRKRELITAAILLVGLIVLPLPFGDP